MSNVTEDASERVHRVAVYPDLEKQYSSHLKSLLWCCFRTKRLSERDRINFVYELDQIISSYKKRIEDPQYFARMANCQIELANTAKVLSNCIKDLIELDAKHIEMMVLVMEELLTAKTLRKVAGGKAQSSWHDLLLVLRKAEVLCFGLSGSLLAIGGGDLQKRKKGHPPLPYLLPTADLIDFWKEWTGEKVPFAKANPRSEKGGGEPGQSATEFIRIALALIDPKVTAAKAITSINNARDYRKRLKAEILRVGHRGIRHYLRSLAKLESSGSIAPTK